ncbi:hypothetical protein GKZ90_0012550 [Flavobacterium sp. MC2016-06]|uniref:hypothetical protein n=1 Tax=Flavobacterium sp. MC2016-06 TaxID=2676308 RepID=UPI0012BAAC54|nr:hypothetical protein [Flavobacterium sp. MC2016-06]MBU3860140.1 hypothetical protein [Flavobacterium sp. MC2016-06]
MNEILLAAIDNEIQNISFARNSYYLKAQLLCKAVFSNIIKDGGDFQTPRPFSNEYFKTIISRGEDRSTILRELKNADILIGMKSYSTGFTLPDGTEFESFCKSYLFHSALIYDTRIGFTQFLGINRVEDRVKFWDIKQNLDIVTIDPTVFTYIPNLVNEQLAKIEIGKQIKDKMITIKIGNKDLEKPRAFWLADAIRNNVALIKFKDKFYLEGVRSFKERKRIELEIFYTYSCERIVSGNFYANRNETNNRLDYNFTGLKKELFKYVILDGEPTVEIDMKNAQFAILSNLSMFNLDENFIELAQSGQLYEYLEKRLSINREEVKEYLIVVAFGEAQYHPKELIDIFPVTMQSISDFKNEHGYKKFSVELQKGESRLMIDGVFNMLSKNNIPVLPVHDSMRVKLSDAVRVKKMMEDFFLENNFKCTLKKK